MQMEGNYYYYISFMAQLPQVNSNTQTRYTYWEIS